MNVVYVYGFLAVVMILVPSSLMMAVAPLSHVTVMSNKMICSPTGNKDKDYTIVYTDNVRVTLADASVITAKKLEIIMKQAIVAGVVKKTAINQERTSSVTKGEASSPYKEIIFEGNVHIKRREHTVTADKAEFIVAKQACKVDGNVKIVQGRKQAGNSTPIVVESQRAYLDLTSEKLVLLGNEQHPVSTVLVLGEKNNTKPQSGKTT